MRVLHLLSQQPAYTGSGVALHEIVHQARVQGVEQQVLVGLPFDEAHPGVGGLASGKVHALRFGDTDLPFDLPGMSDLMPYPSTRFSKMSEEQLTAYRQAWREILGDLLQTWKPELIQSNHVWLLSALAAELSGEIPLVIYSHATGLRQLELCPHLADEVIQGCRRASAWLVLHEEQRRRLARTLGVDLARVHVVGSGYSERLFHCKTRIQENRRRLLYVGKYSNAKGVPELLSACSQLHGEWELHVAGAGAGLEAAAISAQMESHSRVIQHGQLSQAQLAELMRECDVLVLPSFYEGLPLVLAEARACGCRLVATALPGVLRGLAPHMGDSLHLVTQPEMIGIDQISPAARPAFISELRDTLARALDLGAAGDPGAELAERFSWSAPAGRMLAIWRELSRDTV